MPEKKCSLIRETIDPDGSISFAPDCNKEEKHDSKDAVLCPYQDGCEVCCKPDYWKIRAGFDYAKRQGVRPKAGLDGVRREEV